VHPKRQDRGHPHGVEFVDGELWVPDLGGDAVYRYRVERGSLSPLPPLATAPGTGPRLIVRHPALPVCHLVHELSNEVTVWRRDGASWSIVQRVGTLEVGFAGRSAASDIRLSHEGRHLYVSNRGENTVVGYEVAMDGTLKPVTRVHVHGEHPRAFALSPDGAWLLVANRDSNNITVFRRNVETGALRGPTSELAVPAPACLSFLPVT
jgi:6-phosphogluconolactonase